MYEHRFGSFLEEVPTDGIERSIFKTDSQQHEGGHPNYSKLSN